MIDNFTPLDDAKTYRGACVGYTVYTRDSQNLFDFKINKIMKATDYLTTYQSFDSIWDRNGWFLMSKSQILSHLRR